MVNRNKKEAKIRDNLLKKATLNFKKSCLTKAQSLTIQTIILKGFAEGCTDDEIAKRIDDKFINKEVTKKDKLEECDGLLKNNCYFRKG